MPPSDEIAAARAARRLAAGFAVLVALTLCLIVLGALVRAHEAGLACPDWPLCFGEFVPQMDLRVAFEWSHRVLAGSLSIAFAALAFGVMVIVTMLAAESFDPRLIWDQVEDGEDVTEGGEPGIQPRMARMESRVEMADD